MEKVLFYGNFGVENTLALDGQTSKTRNTLKAFKRVFPTIETNIFNTHSFKRKPLLNYFKLIKKIKDSTVAVIFPGSVKNLKFVTNALKKNKKIKVLYPIVGGWLADSIRNDAKLISDLKKFVCLYPETKGLKEKLTDIGIDNTKISPVFTFRKLMPLEQLINNYRMTKKDDELRLVYFGRVSKYKGIYSAIDAVLQNNSINKRKWSLDIYGKFQIGENEKEFESKLNDKIRYLGVLADEQVSSLSNYDFFLFPTFYKGEGFPAACVEALQFATPIIASDWAYNKEIIKEGDNGFLFSLGDNNLFNKINEIINKKYDIIKLKENAYKSSLKYTPFNALKPFFEDVKEILR